MTQRLKVFDRPVERAMTAEDKIRRIFLRDGQIDDEEQDALGDLRGVVTGSDYASLCIRSGLRIMGCGDESRESRDVLKQFPGAWPEEDDPQAA